MKTIYCFEDEKFNSTFIKVPKVLLYERKKFGLSIDGIMLYAFMLNRASMSKRNGWKDEQGRLYIFFTLDDVMQVTNCKKTKASRLLSQLDELNLIEREHRGIGRANKIYVKKLLLDDCGKAV